MSSYYKPDRNPNWNYGGDKFRLSRSKIGLFLECRRCFYIDNKLGTARPPGYPFNLNSAVDALLKKEFDIHRAAHTPHPLAQKYGLNLIPFADERMDEWRDSLRKGITFRHASTGLLVSGGVDDVWMDPATQELVIVDYKSTSKDGAIVDLNEEWHDGYKRQMEVYQWLFRNNGFAVSDTGYFVYANASRDKEAFDGRLEFDVTLVPYTGSDAWVEETLIAIKACLESAKAPDAHPECDYCRYREAAGRKLALLARA